MRNTRGARVQKRFHKKEQSEVTLNLENFTGEIIVETKKVLVIFESVDGVLRLFELGCNGMNK